MTAQGGLAAGEQYHSKQHRSSLLIAGRSSRYTAVRSLQPAAVFDTQQCSTAKKYIRIYSHQSYGTFWITAGLSTLIPFYYSQPFGEGGVGAAMVLPSPLGDVVVGAAVVMLSPLGEGIAGATVVMPSPLGAGAVGAAVVMLSPPREKSVGAAVAMVSSLAERTIGATVVMLSPLPMMYSLLLVLALAEAVAAGVVAGVGSAADAPAAAASAAQEAPAGKGSSGGIGRQTKAERLALIHI